MPDNKLLEVKNLVVKFYNEDGVIQAVDDVSFHIDRGETLGVVGESGCGKSVTALSLMQLVPGTRGVIENGSIYYYQDENNVINITELGSQSRQMRKIRGNEIAMIFQEPMTSLNPVYTIGNQIMESILLHQETEKMDAKEKAIEMLTKVGISAPEQRVDEYPHQLSGGMRQRVMIAMALSCDPSLLIADEPTTALDVTIEAQILKLMRDLQLEFNMTIMFITHDLGVIGEMADRVNVMYTGKLVETATTDQIFYNSQHPYTKGLLNSIPKIGKKKRLIPISGSVPNLLHLPEGCYFAPRCPHAMDICKLKKPKQFEVEEGHLVNCWLYDREEAESA